MEYSLRLICWLLSFALHVAVLVGALYVSTGSQVRIDLNRRVYEVDLVGPANRGKPGAKALPQLAARDTRPKRVPPKEVKPTVAPEQKKKPKAVKEPTKPVPDTATPIPSEAMNATVEPPKKDPPKKELTKEEKPKTDPSRGKDRKPKETQSPAGKKDSKKSKTPSKEDVLAQALKEIGQEAGVEGGSTRGSSRGTSSDPLADALADAGRQASGRGTSGDGSAGDGGGEGQSMGTLDEWYASQAVKAIRRHWRFPRVSSVVFAATVELRVSQEGEILASRLLNGSGRPDYDASVLRAVADTQVLPPLPEGLPSTMVITFHSIENE